MKSLLFICVKTYIRIGLFFYFKNIKVIKHAKIPKNKPILFLGNHQNALLDPLIMAVAYGRNAHFLTRAQVFKKPLVKKILQTLQLIPVYRIRDGWQNIKQNDAIFNQCIALLSTNEAVTIFPEGSHNLKRTVRPLSKGFTRIVLGVLEKNPKSDLQLFPVGLNYKKATQCPDEVVVVFGKPLTASNYILSNTNETIIKLKADVYHSLTQLTTHIESNSYTDTLSQLEALHVDFLKPEKVNGCIKSNFLNCETQTKKERNVLKIFFKALLISICLVPYLVWKKVAQPKIKEIEFTATFRFAIAITLVPLWLLLIAFLIAAFSSLQFSLYFFVLTLVIALLAVKL